MAKEFLARILTIENSVTSESSRDCIICQEKCGTLSPETGIMELEVRLPCSHTVGSACIAGWLANNNTCPLCRHEFFPCQPRPYMEHEVMQGTGDEEPGLGIRRQGESDDDYLNRLLRNSEFQNTSIGFAFRFSQQLELRFPVVILAGNIADSADSQSRLGHRSAMTIGAASVYIASYILNQPRSLVDIARLAAVNESTIYSVCRDIYSERYELIDEYWRHVFGGATLSQAVEALPSLPWPPLEPAFIDGEDEEHLEEENDSGPSALGGSLELVKELCLKFHWDNDPDNLIRDIAQKVAEKMNSMRLDWTTSNPEIIAAACIYMASQLVFQGKTFEQISTVTGVNPDSIRSTYEVMYLVRELIIQDDWFEMFLWTRENALYCMPKP